MLHGRAIIDLHNTKTHRDERIVHDNMLTNWFRDIQNPATIYGGGAASQTSLSRPALLRGLLMFGSALTNDADDYLIPSPDVNEVIAHADTETYSGTDMTRGSFNSAQSSNNEGTITSVWDFTQEQGNGTIASLGLCRTMFGRLGNGSKYYDSVVNNKVTYTNYATPYAPYDASRIKYGSSVGIASYFDKTHGHVITMCVQSGHLKVKRNWGIFGVINPLRANIETTISFVETADPAVEDYDLTAALGTTSTTTGFVSDDGKFYVMASGNLNTNATRTLVIFDILAKTYTTVTITNNVGEQLFFPSPSTNNVGASFVIADGIMYCVTNSGSKAAYINLSDSTDCGVITAPSGSGNVQVGYSSPCVGIYKWGNLVIAGNMMVMLNNCNYVYVLHKGESWYLPLYKIGAYTYGNGQAMAMGHNLGKWMTGVGGANDSVNADRSYNNKLILAPALVTKNNLQSAVTKTADMTMRVTYTVTDQAEE